MFGFLNVYKPAGKTSHDVVAFLRRITKIKQIGHAGTLDPFAEGVLPVSIGKATRLIEYLHDDKEYLAYIQFGTATDTYDIEGSVVSKSDLKVSESDVKNVLKDFEGEIFQTPPIYSAIKLKGKKLYEYARNNQAVEIQPRKVFIKNIELQKFDEFNQTAEILISCSKGTYIRSIANDLGQKLGCGAYLYKLIRTKAGKFEVKNSIVLPNNIYDIEKNLINPLEVLDLPIFELSEEENKKVFYGQAFENKSAPCNNLLILVYNNNISAVAENSGGMIKVKKVFL